MIHLGPPREPDKNHTQMEKNGIYYNGLYRDYRDYIGVILG